LQNTHKAIHKTKSNLLSRILKPNAVSEPDPDTGLYNPFPTYPFTGRIRPVYPLSPRRPVPDSIQKPDYAEDGMPKSERTYKARNQIVVLDEKGIAAMRKAAKIGREVLDIAAAAAVPGVTTDYIDELVHKACIERDVCIDSVRCGLTADKITRLTHHH
jgi:methionyl aminopeptidase